MSWLAALRGRAAVADRIEPTLAPVQEARSVVDTRHPRDPVLASIFGVADDAVHVTPDSAMRVTAVYACVSLIAEIIASLPLHVYRRAIDAKTGRPDTSKAKDHPLYYLLHDMPLPGMTAFEWRETMVTHTALRGDSYALIETANNGRIRALRPIHPAYIRPELTPRGTIRYHWTPQSGGATRVMLDDEILRIPHKMLDGITSLSPIALHRETIGTTVAATRYLNRFYRNNATPKGGLKVPAALSPEATAALRSSWEQRHAGPENAGRLAIFDGGMDWVDIGMTMDDAQYIELQQFSIQDVARIFLVPPHKIGDLSKATFSNIEHQAIEFVTDTLNRWCKRIEGRMNAYLLSEADRRAGYYVAFDLKGLLAGDSAARAKFYQALFYIGAISPNEIREAEDRNPYEGGDRYFVQGAATPVDMVDAAVAARPAPPAPPPQNQNDGGSGQ